MLCPWSRPWGLTYGLRVFWWRIPFALGFYNIRFAPEFLKRPRIQKAGLHLAKEEYSASFSAAVQVDVSYW